MKLSIPAALTAAALLPASGLAQESSCADEFAEFERQIEGSALQAAYEGREAAHPMVLRMADGELVDLTGTIITATPYESWTGNSPVVEKVGGFLTEAKPMIEAGDEEGCSALLEQARAEIESFQAEQESSDAAASEPAAEPMEGDSDQAADGAGAAAGEEAPEGSTGLTATEEEAAEGPATESEAGAAEQPAEPATEDASGAASEPAEGQQSTPRPIVLPEEQSGEADTPN